MKSSVGVRRKRRQRQKNSKRSSTTDNYPKSFPPNVEPHEMAEAILNVMPLVTMSDTNEILLYKDGVYISGGEAYLAAKVEQALHDASLDKSATNHFFSELYGHIRRRTYKEREQFDANPFILNLKNGLLDLQTHPFKFKPHTPNYLSLVQLPVKYDPKAKCPAIRKFLNEVLYPQDLPTIQEFVGYTLYREYPAQKAFLLVGEGSNGKSTFINLIKALLGIANISSRGLQELESNRFAKASLHGKLVNLYADLPDTALRSVGIFKMMTGGDPITGEHKHRNPFNFTNYAKLIFSTNRIPRVIDDDSDAFFRRWIILTFPHTFSGEKEDRNLLQKLTTEEELSGFLHWTLEGLMRLHDNGWRFSDSRSTAEIREEYIRNSSPIQAFLMDCITQKPDAKTSKQILYQKYCEYCRLKRMPIVSSDTFYKHMPEFIMVESAKVTIEGKRVACFIGLQIKPKEEWRHETDPIIEEKDRQSRQDGLTGLDEYDPSVEGVHSVQGSEHIDDASGSFRARVLCVLRTIKGPFSDDYAAEQIMQNTGMSRNEADAWIKHLTKEGMLVLDPESYLRLVK